MTAVGMVNATSGFEQDVAVSNFYNLNTLCQSLCAQITADNKIITISAELFNSMTSGEKKYIAEKIMSYIDTDAVYVKDASTGSYFLGASSNFPCERLIVTTGGPSTLLALPAQDSLEQKSKAIRTRKDVKGEKVPRPCNAFILFRKHWHETVKNQNPGLHNNMLSKIIGNMWQSESNSVRSEWKALAGKKAQEHALLHPGYQYRPRKPAEKKRRMTKAKKAAALTAIDAQPTASITAQQQLPLTAPVPTTNTIVQGFGASQRPPLSVVSRLEIVTAEEYASLQEAELNSLPWDFLKADFFEGLTGQGFEAQGFEGQDFEGAVSKMDYSMESNANFNGEETVSPGSYFLN